jgi:hypothetical protein
MKLQFSLAVILATASPGLTQQALGTAKFNDELVVLFDNNTWRYDDAGGARCTELLGVGSLCALPSDWFPLPLPANERQPIFRHNDIFEGKIFGLVGPPEDPVNVEDILRFINYDREKDSNFGLTVSDDNLTIQGVPATTMVSVIGTGETRVYSYAWIGDRVILAVTWEPSFQYTYAHKDAHRSLVSQIKVSE